MTNPIPPSQPKSGIPKIFLILGGILLIILVCCCGGLTICGILAKRAANTAVSSLPGIIQEQAAKEGLHIDVTGNGVALPDNFPSDVPQYPGAKVMGAITPPDQRDAGTVFFQTNATKKQVIDFYKSDLLGKGWKQLSLQDTGDAAILAMSRGDRSILISCAGDKEGTVNVVYGVQKNSKPEDDK